MLPREHETPCTRKYAGSRANVKNWRTVSMSSAGKPSRREKCLVQIPKEERSVECRSFDGIIQPVLPRVRVVFYSRSKCSRVIVQAEHFRTLMFQGFDGTKEGA